MSFCKKIKGKINDGALPKHKNEEKTTALHSRKNVVFSLHLSFEFLPTVYWPLLQKLIYDVFKKCQKYSSSILSTKSCKNTEGKSEVLPKPLETQVNMRMKNQ